MEYKPLNLSDYETRFLRVLEPSPKDGSFRAEIVTASLTKAPEYSALSYTWGKKGSTVSIQVDGQDVPVTKNLGAALKELDLATGALIWIDALCINQGDLYEKSYQVGFMGEIYARAMTVIVWLGKANVNTGKAIVLLNGIGEYLESNPYIGDDQTEFGRKCLTGSIRNSVDPGGTLRGLLDTLTRDFWERVWIIQEIARAKNVIVRCGRFQTSLEPIWTIFNHVPGISSMTVDLLNAIHRFRSSQQSIDEKGITLLEALVMTKRSRATEPRDCVYALLSITTDGRELVPLADYNTPLETVFGEISTRILTRKRQTTVLLLASRTSPSWQSLGVDAPNRLAVQWTELHELVPEWIIRSVLQSTPTAIEYTPALENDQIKITADYLGTIVDCENHTSDASYPQQDSTDHARSSKISDLVTVYREDVIYICEELNPGGLHNDDELPKEDRQVSIPGKEFIRAVLKKNVMSFYPTSYSGYRIEKFAEELRQSGWTERSTRPDAGGLLNSPFQRLGHLRYRHKELWSLAALYEKEQRSPQSQSQSTVTMPTPKTNERLWSEVETQLEKEIVFGMQFGVVEREVHVKKWDNSFGRYITLSNISASVYSGIAFMCREARPGDMLFRLPGFRLTVVLRPVYNDRSRYRLIGECFLRATHVIWRDQIYIVTKR